ncbi:hypothetical protein [Burkholderia lata]|uniref:hypothetical protein n=1 Tax=Burkholderia lata (strain ATCC 17760 / DSM 23089 / LMG 22485 / NCIMB 9086 / R18194 / 383) TaxID=482957 RepID=UPI0015830AE7|nr:hypothetical protein [Burkholderia lata]
MPTISFFIVVPDVAIGVGLVLALDYAPHHLRLPVLARPFGFLYKVYDGQPGLFTTDDHGNLVKVDPFRVTPSLV